MPLPESFKYDVRVRDRLTRRGLLDEADLEKHIASLPDVSSNALDVELKQPALQTEAERAENSVIVRPAAARPVIVAPTPIEDLEDDDDDEIEVKPVRPVSAVPARKVEPVAAVAAVAAVADDDDDDEDDEDEDEDDEDEDDDDDEDGDAKEEAPATDEPEVEAEPKKEASDDGWEAT
jgi:hypothetical protein